MSPGSEGRDPVVIVADDLTGAAETAAVFAAARPVPVSLPGSRVDEHAPVVVLDTETRNVPRHDALVGVASAIAPWSRSGSRPARTALDAPGGRILWLKKVDSTLRGHVADETLRLVEALGLRGAIVAPALPRQGRTTEGGVQRVRGVPVTATEAGRDPLAAVRAASIGALFQAAGGGPTGLIAADVVDAGDAALAQRMARTLQASEVCIVDAVHDEHLERIARVALDTAYDCLLVGSAGLVRAIAAERSSGPRPAQPPPVGPTAAAGFAGILVVRGSPHPRAVHQAGRLSDLGLLGHHVVDADAEPSEAELLRLVERLQRGGALLEAPPLARGSDPALARRVAERIAGTCAAVASRTHVSAMVVTGGDTAYHLMRGLQASRLDVVREVAPNLPLARLGDGPYRGTVFATKAGGFGEDDALLVATVEVGREVG